jgi:TPR repeat protein
VLASPSYADYADAVKAYSRGDYASAYRQYLDLAQAGDVRAQGTVACMIQAGEGVPSDPGKALFWYIKAAERGLEPAQYSLGQAYENGVGTERDLARALNWYGKAAQQGNGAAQASQARVDALLAARGNGEPPVPNETQSHQNPQLHNPASAAVAPAAVPALSPVPAGTAPAAAPALAEAQADQIMPELIFNGKIAQKLKAAEAGDSEAQLSLGWCYSTGKGVPQDKSQAVRWYRRAAASGRLSAQLALGWLYYSGEAGGKDLGESASWYRKAALQGDGKAKQMLKRIEKEASRR